VLSAAERGALSSLWGEDARFRSSVDMERHRFGLGRYRYFARPLPALVQNLRTRLYRQLAPTANRWAEALRRPERYPPSLKGFLETCRRAGQTRPTPLLLRYEAGGYNRLHRDLYGDVVFPLQAAIPLGRPGEDFGGGEFLLVEQRPRAQSIGRAIQADPGEIVIFPTSDRPVPGRRGPVRASLRHGASHVTWGERLVLGLIFHDAR
jgi:hypothetical protein